MLGVQRSLVRRTNLPKEPQPRDPLMGFRVGAQVSRLVEDVLGRTLVESDQDVAI